MENDNKANDDWRNYSSVKKEATANTSPANNNTPKSRNKNGGVIALVVISLLIGAGGLATGVVALLSNSKSQPVATVSADGYYQGNSVEFEETSVAGIVSKVTPSVVSIISETRSSGYYSFFGSSTSQAAGTGMIVSADGYVLTNKHVVEDAVKLRVVTDSGDTYDDVEIVGEDPLNDVAYLKINNVKDLPAITLGDSKTIAVGQPVLAIGNALGAYQNTVTQGIVSGTGRSVTASDSSSSKTETLTDMIQTDAAINPGNSGGPLVNAAGEVIGINTAVASANGMGFAIPISATKGMLASIMENGKDERAYLGLTYVSVTASVAKEANLNVTHGAYIYNSSSRSGEAIVKNGPADKAGLKTKDVIVKVGNIEVGRAGSISTLVGEYKVGDTIELTYIRDGETYTTNVTLEAYK